jgi:nucleotide-binding universal stress UspA family protein
VSEETVFQPINNILIPTDGSSYSLKAARYASNLAKITNSKVTVMHVINLSLDATEPVKIDDLDRATIEITEESELKRRAKNIVESTMKVFVDENIPVSAEYFLSGKAPETIVETARRESSDLIIMGHKGISGLRHTLLGSVAERVCRQAPCPVLVVR